MRSSLQSKPAWSQPMAIGFVGLNMFMMVDINEYKISIFSAIKLSKNINADYLFVMQSVVHKLVVINPYFYLVENKNTLKIFKHEQKRICKN